MMRFAEDGPDGFPIEVPDPCDHDNHVDYSDDRSLLRGNPLDVARWLLCSEGWLHDAWALDEYLRVLRTTRETRDNEHSATRTTPETEG